MKTVVVYSSKTGFTRTYSEWIAEDLGAALMPIKEFDDTLIDDYDVLIYGGALRVGRVLGLKKFLRRWPKLRDKHVVLFHSGANAGREEEVAKVWKQHLSEEQLKNTSCFFLRGAFDPARLGVIDRVLMSVPRFIISRQQEPDEAGLGLLKLYEEPQLELDRAATEPLVKFVRGIR